MLQVKMIVFIIHWDKQNTIVIFFLLFHVAFREFKVTRGSIMPILMPWCWCCVAVTEVTGSGRSREQVLWSPLHCLYNLL